MSAAETRPGAPAIVVHSLGHAVAALQAAAEAGVPVLLLSAVDAGLSAGAGWWREVVAAARDSVEEIVFSGRDEVRERLADIARGRGSRVYRNRPPAALDLVDDFFAPPEALHRRVLAILRSDSAENRTK